MKKMFLMMAATIISTGIFITVNAQDSSIQKFSKKPPEERAKLQTAQMTKALNLSPEQTKKVDSINLKFAKERDAQKISGTVDRSERMKAMQKMRDEKNIVMQKVLTDDQYNKYLKMQEEQKQKMMDKKKEEK